MPQELERCWARSQKIMSSDRARNVELDAMSDADLGKCVLILSLSRVLCERGEAQCIWDRNCRIRTTGLAQSCYHHGQDHSRFSDHLSVPPRSSDNNLSRFSWRWYFSHSCSAKELSKCMLSSHLSKPGNEALYVA
jgi:hypothetical protein